MLGDRQVLNDIRATKKEQIYIIVVFFKNYLAAMEF